MIVFAQPVDSWTEKADTEGRRRRVRAGEKDGKVEMD